MLQLIGWPTASKAKRRQAIADAAAPLPVSLLALSSNESLDVASGIVALCRSSSSNSASRPDCARLNVPNWVLVVSKLFETRVDSATLAAGRTYSSGLGYALIATMSGWIPMMLISRVRL